MVGVVTRVALWGRAGGCCSEPSCRRALTHFGEGGDLALTGETCHIRSKRPEGPRHDPNYHVDLLDSYDNVLLMCGVHHKIIDTLHAEYTVERLIKIKNDHERWIQETLSPNDKNILRAREEYARLIGQIEKYLDLSAADKWLNWLGHNEYPRIEKEFASLLFDFPTWIVRQFWPNTFSEIEAAVLNLAQSIDDYTHFFVRRSNPREIPGYYAVPKFYKIEEWNPEKYERLSDQWNSVIDEAHDRTLEISKALNLLLKVIRKHVIVDYRREEGWFVFHGTRATENLSAAAVPRYENEKVQAILSNKKYLSVFNVVE